MRFINRVLAALLALGLIIGGLLLVIEVVAQRVGSAPVLVRWDTAYTWANKTTWQSNTLRIVFIVMAIVGLILLIAEIKRTAVRRLPAASSAGNVDIAFTRRGVASAVQGSATDIDGVRGAIAVVGKKSIKVIATSSSTDIGGAKALTESVADAVQRQVNDLHLDPSPQVTVTMRARRG